MPASVAGFSGKKGKIGSYLCDIVSVSAWRMMTK